MGGILVLNVLWANFITDTVPQSGGNVSLAAAAANGEISTVPLIEVIHSSYPQYSWIGTVVGIFVLISVSVSFMALGTGLKHVIDGVVLARTGMYGRRGKDEGDDEAVKHELLRQDSVADAVATGCDEVAKRDPVGGNRVPQILGEDELVALKSVGVDNRGAVFDPPTTHRSDIASLLPRPVLPHELLGTSGCFCTPGALYSSGCAPVEQLHPRSGNIWDPLAESQCGFSSSS